ncbi:hypothetical protein C8F01DRAFT_1179417 [Mycena amicta]|nr:hypothetical protein C8F01DRAFT_1179417 [Mycena amicta]
MSSLLESIRTGKSLRKVGGIAHDASGPSLVDSIAISEKYDNLVLQANIENWGSLLADFTAPTSFVVLTQDHAKLLLRAYESLYRADSDAKVAEAAAEYVASVSGTGQTTAPLCVEEEELLEELGPAIQRAIDAFSTNGEDRRGGCFVKLSSRSAKDAAARSGVFEAHYAAAIKDVRDRGEELDDIKRMWIVCQAESAALRFADAKAVIRALVLSERVWQDMTLALRHPDKWEQNIIVRKWEPVTIDMEFRTFVASGRLTAISQYAYQLCSPRLTDPVQLAKAVGAIKTTFSKLWPVLKENGFESCVLDFGVIPPASDHDSKSEEGEWRATLIEINPFEETTDGALFSWTRERSVIEGKATEGEGDIEYPVVRVTETRRVAALSMIPRKWKDVIEKVEGKV